MAFKVRPALYDVEIWQQVRDEYYPAVINYSTLRRVVDLGGHIGAFTCYVKEQSPQAEVWTVEMDSDNFALLQENTAQWRDVYCYHRICGYDVRFDAYLRNKSNYGNIGLIDTDEWQTIPDTHELVTSLPTRISLEEITLGIDSLDLLKIDVEKAEFDILKNASRETLAKFQWIAGEYHSSMPEFKKLLKRLPDFEVIELEDSNGFWAHFLLRNKHK